MPEINIAYLLVVIPVLLFSLTVHEVAHAWTALKGGDHTSAYLGRLSFNPIVHIDPFGTIIVPALLLLMGQPPFMWAKPVPVNLLRLRRSVWHVYVAMAGPLSNLLLCLTMLLILKAVVFIGGDAVAVRFLTASLSGGGDFVDAAFVFAKVFLQMNIVLMLFNMIPIPPLDGSTLIYHYFVRHHRAVEEFWISFTPFGFIAIVVLLRLPGIGDLFYAAISTPYVFMIRWIAGG